MQGAVIKIPRHGTATAPVIIHQKINDNELDKELGSALDALLIKGVQDGVTGPIRRRAGSLHRRFTKVTHMSAEGPLVYFTILGT